ncbi:hypothetical protein EmuJ_000335600 [Echinococcus multilocularis]|uniref:Uncharacterized protein n=1 Tax=Echinococcus multilocularis TaxID=6211 RepID=A0A068XVJ9_ECHMU|nr:hypothetical protein EmuJ_000335600 [Echinococcus multilocularis]
MATIITFSQGFDTCNAKEGRMRTCVHNADEGIMKAVKVLPRRNRSLSLVKESKTPSQRPTVVQQAHSAKNLHSIKARSSKGILHC